MLPRAFFKQEIGGNLGEKNSRLELNVRTFGQMIVRTSLRAFFNDCSSLMSPATGFAHETRTKKRTFLLSLRNACDMENNS